MDSQELKERALADCTDAQREAIQHVSGPLLVLAGPGSGKTRVITRRIAHLVGSGVRPDEILAITFTNKAAGEMRERVEALGAARGAWLFTFHAFCARVLRMYGERVGLGPNFTIYDAADSLAAVKRAMDDLDLDKSSFKPADIARDISNAKGKFWGPDDLAETRYAEPATVARVYRRYDELLRKADAADFDDLLVFVVRLLKDEAEIGDRLRRRFRHVLIDEYQDTNHAQFLIAKYLASAHRNICAAGDPDQSIYGWRGANIGNILDFEEDYPDAKVVRLEQNYRSTKRILSAADRLIANNQQRKPKALWTENDEGDAVRVLRCEDEGEEARRIAEEIRSLIKTGGAAPRDVAVFYRTNAQSREIELALQHEALPYNVVNGTAFYERKEIKDLLAYLRLVVNPADDVSAERVANVPPRKLGGTSVQRIRQFAAKEGMTLLRAMSHGQEAGVRGGALGGIQEFQEILRALRDMPPAPAAPIVERLIRLAGYEAYLKDAYPDADDRMDNARELINAAARYDDEHPDNGLAGFLEETALVSDVDALDQTRGAITLMTLHTAKGLEFPIVYIVGLEKGLLPLARDEIVRDLEEERRLLFVGITRAKRRVTLTFAESRKRFGQTQFTEPSLFLSEMPEEVEQEEGWPRGGRAGSFNLWAETAPRRRRRAGGRAETDAPSFDGARRAPRIVQRGAEQIVYDSDDHTATDFAPPPPFRPGEQVVHDAYGRGKVVDVRGFGEAATVRVLFPVLGVKRFKLAYANLRRAGA